MLVQQVAVVNEILGLEQPPDQQMKTCGELYSLTPLVSLQHMLGLLDVALYKTSCQSTQIYPTSGDMQKGVLVVQQWFSHLEGKASHDLII